MEISKKAPSLRTLIVGLSLLSTGAVVTAQTAAADEKPVPPAKVFDLSQWNITLPTDSNRDSKPD